MNGFIKTQATTPNQILFMTEPYAAVGIVVANTGVDAGADGKKIIKAGTPVTGNLEARNTPFTVSAADNVVGVVLHDVDVTAGNANATLLIHGYVNLNNLDSTTAGLITSTIKTALKAKVTFLK